LAQPRLQQIADLAGVSPATVSRVLNNRPEVSGATRQQVINALRRLGGGVASDAIVGFIMPDSRNPFFTDLAFRLQDQLQDRNLHLLIASSDGKVDREVTIIDQFKALGVSGLIYTGAGADAGALLSLVGEGKLPVIALDRKVRAGNIDSVVASSYAAMLNAVSLLIARGHSRLAYLHGPLDTEPGRERLSAFQKALAHNGLAPNEAPLSGGDFSLDAGRRCADRLLDTPIALRPSAVLTANDLMAIGLSQRLQQAGWRIPEQLSIIGFDDIEWAAANFPSLTTIQQPYAELVAETSRLIELRIQQYRSGGEAVTPPISIELDCRLTVRDSVGPAPDMAAANASEGASS
jgi:LacI family transcriptional regulator